MSDGSSWKPNLFVAGFPKCGTTALCDYLAQNPDVYLIEVKEPRTLSRGERIPHWYPWAAKVVDGSICMDFDVYRSHYERHSDKKYRIDGSWSYSVYDETPAKLTKFSPHSKSLLIIRDGRKRLVSKYFYTYPDHLETDFTAFIHKYIMSDIEGFCFYNHVKAFHEAFGSDLRVLTNGSLAKSPQLVMDSVFGFLGLDSVPVRKIESNVGRFNALSSETDRQKFAKSYSLAKLVGAPARAVLDNTGLYGQKVKVLLSSLSPTLYVENKYAELSQSLPGRADEQFIEQIPENVTEMLNDDYAATLDYCKANSILLTE